MSWIPHPTKKKLEEIRYSVDICEEEHEFQKIRNQFVLRAMQTVLGDRGPKDVKDHAYHAHIMPFILSIQVPTIGILGSGGGFRAVTALSGATCALKDIGIFDCAMYFAGLSGSSWYISTLYSHPQWPNIKPSQVNGEIRECLEQYWERFLFNPIWLYKTMKLIEQKKERGQPVSYTDLFGHLIGDMLLVNRINPVLSDQRKTFQDGVVPMPLYACIHVKTDVTAKLFSGICGSAFAVLLKEVLKDPDDHKNIAKKLSEIHDDRLKLLGKYMATFMLSYSVSNMMALIPTDEIDAQPPDTIESTDENDELDKMIQDLVNRNIRSRHTKGKRSHVFFSMGSDAQAGDDDDENMMENIMKGIVGQENFLQKTEGMSNEVHKYLHGMHLAFTKDNPSSLIDVKKWMSECKRIMLCDGGIAFNSPYPTLLRQQRHVDMVLSFDYSARKKDVPPPSELFQELLKAEQWAKDNRYPFPPINYKEQYKEHGVREYYVFKDDKDPKCPIVIHFPLVNNLFKTYKAPGVPRKTPEEIKAGEMPIFEDPDNSYSTFHFHYKPKAYDRLVELTSFNVKVCKDVICDVMAECVARKHKLAGMVKRKRKGRRNQWFNL
ncbi:hypothetical protein QZH41_018042 [Actinostola sp. cb2023]|nr:hypothetical protein QZH41_018042 [Actinostola sp. cb2023]